MYYSPLLCKSVPRSTSRAFAVDREERKTRAIKKPDSRIHENLVAQSAKIIRPKQFGVEDKQGLGEHYEELAAMNRFDHPIHSPHTALTLSSQGKADAMWQMNLFAAEACA